MKKLSVDVELTDRLYEAFLQTANSATPIEESMYEAIRWYCYHYMSNYTRIDDPEIKIK